MNRLELPAPPTPRLLTFPLPPPPRLAPDPAAGSVAPRRGHDLAAIAIAVAFVLLAGIAAVAASETSKADRRPLFGGERSHSFIGVSAAGEPFRWDPCSTIRYQVDPGRMDDRVLEDVREAVRRTGEASGLRFRFDGVVHTSVSDLVASGNFVTSGRDGLAWSPVLIAFRSRIAMRNLGIHGALGVTFPVTTRFDADQFVSGAIVINTSAGLVDGFARAPSVGTVVQHELGHAVGLGHYLDPFQLMSPTPVVRDWGKGDLAGLERLGAGPCLDVPTAELHAAIVPLP